VARAVIAATSSAPMVTSTAAIPVEPDANSTAPNTAIA
jgi:hypothetical protein